MQQHIHKGGLKVLVLGFPRTGQTSMHALLTRLHFKCYDDGTVLRNMRAQLPLWHRALEAPNVSDEQSESESESEPIWAEIFGDHSAALGLPTILHWRRLLRSFPQCKVVLLRRDGLLWYRSIFQTFGWFSPMIRLNMKMVPRRLRYRQYFELTHLHCVGFEHFRFSKNKREAMRRFEAFNAEIIDHFQSRDLMHRLFIVDVDVDCAEKARMQRELIEFLEVPQSEHGKEETFPHKSKRSKFFAIYAAMFVFLLYDRGVLDRFWETEQSAQE